MLITKEISIRINNYNREFFKDKNVEYGKYLIINTNELPIGSGFKVDVKCEFCGKEKSLSYRKYIANTKNKTVGYSCSNKCSVVKYEKTCMDLYGVSNVFKLESFKSKYRETCMKLYGVDNAIKNEEVSASMVKTKEDSGIYSSNRSEYTLYKNKCRTLSRKNRIETLSKWNGYDYYDKEYILDNLKLHHLNANYPTVDHKLSILEGFKNKIDPDIISKIDNLCVTKRKINCSYGGKKK